MLFVETMHQAMIDDVLKQYPYTFYAYGSRVKGTHRLTSDLDICFTDTIPFHVQSHIDEDFEQSDLAFRVEVNDFHLMSEEFQHQIRPDLLLLQAGTRP